MGYQEMKIAETAAGVGAVASAIGAGVLAKKNKKKKVSKGAIALSVLSAGLVGGFFFARSEKEFYQKIGGGMPEGVVKNIKVNGKPVEY